MNTIEFENIRPYHDEELAPILEELLADPAFRQIAAVAFPEIPVECLEKKMRSIRTKREFQLTFSCPFVQKIARLTTDALTLNNAAQEDKTKAYTYISNHRDIILDSGFLSILLIDSGIDTVEIAIGDNLLVYPWIKKLVRINKSFIVQRALSMRQMMESSACMSRYIHHTITTKAQSVWIAQREGRAKDANDRTQESVLKMLAMGGEGDVVERLMEINLVPLALSYEYDPCDYLKAKEFQLKRDVEEYRKTDQDDLENMKTGLMGYKGRVHLQTAPCLNNELATLDRSLPKPALYREIAEKIDRSIHRNYRIYPCNYVAHDLLEGDTSFASHYSPAEKEHFEHYLQGQLSRIDLPHKDLPYLYRTLLLMYANPLKNQLEAR
jgi:hypothetical protein